MFAFALGFAFCIPTAFLLMYNGFALGAFVAVFSDKALGFEVGGWLIIHGATEIFAIILAGAAGLHIGFCGTGLLSCCFLRDCSKGSDVN